ncbi:S-adenosyl-L-methionine-dependent methyltransferase [Rhizodiscina lignyota]|uniref:S-adenosyl-L-methionine-dependent methyltransferase n=1 Tax=Rhizodiscina lignyota TaxID=1504668 RepID=A0A9P4I9W1_9PEZI|nr:S-adenosyl-L-methionine-dependent methyltransferase [Rhizodiscina lignyota]
MAIKTQQTEPQPEGPQKTQMSDNMKGFFDTRSAAVHAAHLVPHIKPNMRILDVGCGYGSITIDFANLVPKGSVLGIDASDSMVKYAEEARSAGSISNMEVRKMNAMDLHELEDESFDAVHAHQVLLHVTDPVKALREMRRVLKPGGVLASRDMASLFLYPFSDDLKLVYNMYEKLADATGTNSWGGKRTHVWAHEAGFDLEKIEHTATNWAVTTRKEVRIWAESSEEGIPKAAFEAGCATEEEYDLMRTAWKEWAMRQDSWMGVLDGLILCRK